MSDEILGKIVWGKKWNNSMFRARDWECHCRGFSYSDSSLKDNEWVKHVVGVDDVGPENYSRDPSYKHVMIFKCPKCFEYFYFHVEIMMIAEYFELKKEIEKSK